MWMPPKNKIRQDNCCKEHDTNQNFFFIYNKKEHHKKNEVVHNTLCRLQQLGLGGM